MYELAFLTLSLLGWVMGSLGLFLALYTKHTMKAQVTKEVSEAKADLAGTEARLEKYLEKRLNEAAIDLRKIAQNDAIELYESVANEGKAFRGYGNGREYDQSSGNMGFASFRNL